MSIKAIETRYAGCRFRSRLEARWAVFFDSLGIEWEYEPEGFELPSGWYLPDFWLPEGQAWVEIKGQRATLKDALKVIELGRVMRQRGHKVRLVEGDIPRSAGHFGSTYVIPEGCVGIRGTHQIFSAIGPDWPHYAPSLGNETHRIDVLRMPERGSLSSSQNEALVSLGLEVLLPGTLIQVGSDLACLSTRSPQPKYAIHTPDGLEMAWEAPLEDWDLIPSGWTPNFSRAEIDKALTTARSARFEHGEVG